MADWTKFDSAYDLDELQKDINKAEETEKEYDDSPVPEGTYEVKIEKLELAETKGEKPKPKVSIWFRILNGSQENRLIFMNQVIAESWQIKIMMKFLQSLETGEYITFESFSQFSKMLDSILGVIEDNKLEFALKYGKNKKGYNTFKIEEVFEN